MITIIPEVALPAGVGTLGTAYPEQTSTVAGQGASLGNGSWEEAAVEEAEGFGSGWLLF